MKALKLGVVGPGLIWHGTHKKILADMTSFSVVGFCSRRKETLDRALVDYPQAKPYGSYQELVADPEIEGVVVTTPIALNPEVAIAALKMNKHVFLEKPVCTSVEQGMALIEAEKNSRGTVFVLEQILYHDFWAQLINVCKSGKIGTLSMFDSTSHGYIGVDKDPWGFGKTEWRVNGEFPLGPLFDGGIHEIALLNCLFGAPTEVYARGRSHRKDHGQYDVINMMFEYPDGMQGIFSHSGFLGGGHRNSFLIRGTEGLICNRGFEATVESKDGKVLETIVGEKSAESFFGGLHKNMWNEFVRVLDGSATLRYTLTEAVRDVAVLKAVEASLETGVRVKIT
ncbi:MAG: Gfo/Idh/MocA family oxidoreductase [Verrucomicrobiota bacterium]|nr:Gfo/Idh/MocA family oxidoreductase [Verrucomicrobiota bacterium]